MPFEFATANRIIFGSGVIVQAGDIAASLGTRALVVTGANAERARPLLDRLGASGVEYVTFSVATEPTVDVAQRGAVAARAAHCNFVIGIGGGSALDSAKATAALLTNDGNIYDYLEVIGQGQPLVHDPAPCLAVPTTAGTGSEVTRNAVLASPEHRVKVSLRSAQMLPDVALVDPELTHGLPPDVTAHSGLDALIQCLEPLVSIHANPLTDGIAWEGLRQAAQSLERAYADAQNPKTTDAEAREGMALASLCGGLALANAKLGAVHGLAGPLGGLIDAPHGAICAALLPPALAVNVRTLREREPKSPRLGRYTQIFRILTSDDITPNKKMLERGIDYVERLGQRLSILGLSHWTLRKADFDAVVEKAARSSSMKGNPIALTDEEVREILERAL